MERLFRSGILLGASVLVALFLGSPALADSAPGAAAQAATPAVTAPPSKVQNKAAESKSAAEKHHHMRKHHKGMSLVMRKDVQTALNSHGAKLKVDGKMGTASREAIKKFQSENSLKATGRLNKETMEKLGVKKA